MPPATLQWIAGSLQNAQVALQATTQRSFEVGKYHATCTCIANTTVQLILPFELLFFSAIASRSIAESVGHEIFASGDFDDAGEFSKNIFLTRRIACCSFFTAVMSYVLYSNCETAASAPF